MAIIKTSNLIKIGVGLLVILLAGYVFKSCWPNDEASRLRGVIETQETFIKQQEERTRQAKETYEKSLIEKDANIVYWQEVAEKNAAGMTVSTSEIKDLKERLTKLNPAEKDAIIETQGKVIIAQENKIAENITLACNAIAAKDKVITAWEGAFRDWETYRVELETENSQLHSLVGTEKDLNARLEKDLRWARGQGKLKNILLAGAVGYVLYSGMKK